MFSRHNFSLFTILFLLLCLVIVDCTENVQPNDDSNRNKNSGSTDSQNHLESKTKNDIVVNKQSEKLSELSERAELLNSKSLQATEITEDVSKFFISKNWRKNIEDLKMETNLPKSKIAMDIYYKVKNGASLFEIVKSAAELGNDPAKLQLAKMYFFGDEAELDLDTSFKYFSELSAKGYPDANLYLGFMHSIGLGPVKSNQAKALLYYTFAALSDDDDYKHQSHLAKMALGYRYLLGIGVPPNCEFSLSYYRVVAKKVEENITFAGSNSILRIRLLDELENPGSYGSVLDDDLIHYYQFLAEKGDIQAQVGLGQLHFQGGRGVNMNQYRAYQYFKMAAESGNTNAMAFLGKMYLEGIFVEQDYDTSFKYFKMAADKGNSVGQSGLGIIYLYGKGVEKDYKMALKYFSQASSQGWVDGQLYLGIMYLKGYGLPKDYKMAIKYFTLASQSGHVLGFYNLAEMNAQGIGTSRSCNLAVELFKSVSEKGPWGNLLSMAYNNYKEGKRVNAFIKYAVLSELGYEIAQSNAAFLLDRNEVPELFNETEIHSRAFMYWSRSASQGYSIARVKLGDYHYYGLGTKVDYEMAVNQYRLASDSQNNAQALFNLGYMYETGLGLKRDIYLAKRFYDLAALASTEAQVPVALALIKLCFIFIYEYFKVFNLKEFKFIADWATYWDLYSITLLTLALGTILYLRRQGAG